MSRTPRVTGSELIAALAKADFSVLRVKGSHHFLRHQDGRSTVVPVRGETIGPGLLHKILRACRGAKVIRLLHRLVAARSIRIRVQLVRILLLIRLEKHAG
jgi:predicted RNA binding protein YcfA (HicA-like mRNA interferase family)